jgi:hypothetical protein
MPKYEVLTPILADGKRVAAGEILPGLPEDADLQEMLDLKILRMVPGTHDDLDDEPADEEVNPPAEATKKSSTAKSADGSKKTTETE